ncbi:MAG: TusE/DsrC/DsvC family sulfur relay protein [Chromatiales bacterium]|jgi:tRNA 2-thiouridine synthesizing protein E
MSELTVSGKTIPLNEHGFLVNFGDWSPDVAKAMAEEDRLELMDCHWDAFAYMREYYSTYEVPPNPRILIKEVGDKLDQRKCTKKTLDELFPEGGCKHACRLAGLPESFCYSC